MARAVTRPKIVVQSVYSGNENMQEIFISLLVSEVRQRKNSVRTFENIKDTEYNKETKAIKEAS